ncbi:hypothetical protein [Neotamlana laminarinivorans]|uniref:Uncharacterized protein n=1 Tax=Neotamlana laminarinivorans TaxID=2883124 RepID=A0A9X1HXC1_9FLAO|nr:hypothetical protein [Tamlana laminarinivorans]MCB4797301.1 hypothetical protein [Tamlana laminarinivorans]
MNNSVIRAKSRIVYFLLFVILFNCSSNSDSNNDGETSDDSLESNITNYSGTASVSQGLATTTVTNLYPDGTRVASLGTITSYDDIIWTVPAEGNYENDAFPFAPDLYNPNGTQNSSSEDALINFDDNDIVEIDADGDLITAYVFADNYFELYINGTAVGKDAIPFTEFNSHIIKFKVNLPFTIAMLLVDWEENLGVGSELNQGYTYYPGDGGVVAVFKDTDENIIATTGSEWKAQTFYTAPIKDLSCPSEENNLRLTDNCDTTGSTDGTSYYALHWEIPSDWTNANFDDSEWPSASTYTNTEIGVNNKPSYTNFTDIFDDNNNDAEFIWSTNVILDNEVIVRYTVE